jgi:osmotically inducible protein OsmC
MAAQSKATAHWEGALEDGRGTARVDSGAIPEVEVTWQARVERTTGTTSPEELLAAAHAACFCMAFAHQLAGDGNPPESLDSAVAVEFVPGEGVTSSRIEIRGRVPGLDQGGFEQAAATAHENCPISGALRGNVEMDVQATLES